MRNWLLCIVLCLLLICCISQDDLEMQCGRPPAIPHGDILELLKTDYSAGEIVTYKCQSFYVLRGSPEVHCVNGNWTELPVCIDPCIVTVEEMNLNNIRLRWIETEKLYMKSRDMVEFSCKDGFEPHPLSYMFRQRCIEGRLVYPKCIPET
nr:complement factor H-related protein 2 [Anolis sagrei ordinatus]